MKTRVETLGKAAVVVPEGRLDFAAAAGFQQQLEQALAGDGAAPAALIVDCVALEYVSSAGLRALLVATRAAARAGIPFALSTLRPAVREVFDLSGFSRMMTLHTDRATALEHTTPGARYPERRTAVTNDAAQLPVLTRFLQEFWSGARLPGAPALTFELALEEVFMNVVMHGAPAGTARVEVSLVLSGSSLAMTIEDDGPHFDPMSLPAPDVSAGLNERRVGGQGVFLVRQMMDEVRYQRVGGRNRLRLSKRVDG